MRHVYTYVLFLCVLSLAVNAASIEQTQSFSSERSLSIPLTFQKYERNESLQSVQCILTIEISGGYIIPDNDNDERIIARVELGFEGSLISEFVTLLDDSLKPVIHGFKVVTGRNLNLEADDGDGWQNVQTDGRDTARYTGTVKIGISQGSIGSSFIGNFMGNGTLEINAVLRPILDFGDNSNVEGLMGLPNASGTLQLIYTY